MNQYKKISGENFKHPVGNVSQDQKKTVDSDFQIQDKRPESITQRKLLAIAGNHSVQRRILNNSDDAPFLTPEYLENTLGIQPPQIYKDLYYRLDDAKENIPLKSGNPGNFQFSNKTITIPVHALQYVAGRITGGNPMAGDKEKFRTAMAQLGHEMQHAVDYLYDGKKENLDKDDGTEEKYLAVMDTELRAWATEAIVYKKFGAEINQEGKDLIKGWNEFNEGDIDADPNELIKNAIWARLIQYSTKNKISNSDWKTCIKTGNVLTRAKAEQKRVAEYVDVQAQPPGDVTINTDQELNLYPDFKAGDNRVEKIKKEGGYRYYKFRRTTYIIKNEVAEDSGKFDNAIGNWAAAPVPLVVEEEAVAEDDMIVLDTENDIQQKAPGLKNGGNKITKVKKEGNYKIYEFNGVKYKVENKLIESGYFDAATGNWE